jgi:hypothetical protein
LVVTAELAALLGIRDKGRHPDATGEAEEGDKCRYDQ